MAILDLTTVARIKIADNSYNDAGLEAKIAMYITAVSARVAKYLNRTILSGTYTEYFSLVDHIHSFPLKAWPITSITSVSEIIDEADANPYVIDSDNVFRLDNSLGIIHLENELITLGYSKLKVIYVGGMASTTAAFYADYPDIEQEVIHQVLFELAKSKNLLDKSTSISNQTTTRYDLDLLPSVKRILNAYKRKLGVY